jgi:hypothetical protein
LSETPSDESPENCGEAVPVGTAAPAEGLAAGRTGEGALDDLEVLEVEPEEVEPEELEAEPAAGPRASPAETGLSAEEDRPTEPHLPPPDPGGQQRRVVAPPPPSSRMPPRGGDDAASVAEVVLSPSGELLQSRGFGPDDFAARVAYAARLAELIGRAIRSGTPRALELRGKGTHSNVKWQGDGSISASLELVQSPKIR